MKLLSKLLTRTGIMVAVSAAIMGASSVQAAYLDTTSVPEKQVDAVPARPSPDGPVETRIKKAIEEVDQQGQTALEELGELDSPEKVARAEQVLEQIERASREVRKRAHNRASERFDELNDLAVARLHVEARVELEVVGQPDTAEKRQRAEQIRARIDHHRERLEDARNRWRERLEQRHQERPLPQFDFRRPNGAPPDHATALGLRMRLEAMTDAEVETAIQRLEQEAQTSLNDLGELDTPGKALRARKIRARLEERVKELRERLAHRVREQASNQLDDQVHRLRLRAEDAVKQLGELDTPEKQRRAQELRAKFEEQIEELRARLGDRARVVFNEQFEEQAEELRRRAQAAIDSLGELDSVEKQQLALSIRVRLDEDLSALRERLGDRTHLALQEQVDQESNALRRRAQAALQQLGELDTPEKQEMARRIRARLEEQEQRLREQLARRAHHSFEENFEDESTELRLRAEAELRALGRLDTPAKVERARQIRARMELDINDLKRRQAERLRADFRTDVRAELRPGQARDALTDRVRDSLRNDLQDQRNRVNDARDRTMDNLRDNQEHRDQLRDQVGDLQDRLRGQTRQAVRSNPDPVRARAEAEARAEADTTRPTPEPHRKDEEHPEESNATDASGNSNSDARP